MPAKLHRSVAPYVRNEQLVLLLNEDRLRSVASLSAAPTPL